MHSYAKIEQSVLRTVDGFMEKINDQRIIAIPKILYRTVHTNQKYQKTSKDEATQYWLQQVSNTSQELRRLKHFKTIKTYEVVALTKRCILRQLACENRKTNLKQMLFSS